MIPSEQENPSGLHGRYNITKASGEPCDPDAVYFVLRLDSGGGDYDHILACRVAARRYVEAIRSNPHATHLWQMASDLEALIERLESEVPSD